MGPATSSVKDSRGNILSFRDRHHAEYDPYASTLFISSLTCSLVGREMSLTFAPDSKVSGSTARFKPRKPTSAISV
jgi:hypothetical protein